MGCSRLLIESEKAEHISTKTDNETKITTVVIILKSYAVLTTYDGAAERRKGSLFLLALHPCTVILFLVSSSHVESSCVISNVGDQATPQFLGSFSVKYRA